METVLTLNIDWLQRDFEVFPEIPEIGVIQLVHEKYFVLIINVPQQND